MHNADPFLSRIQNWHHVEWTYDILGGKDSPWIRSGIFVDKGNRLSQWNGCLCEEGPHEISEDAVGNLSYYCPSCHRSFPLRRDLVTVLHFQMTTLVQCIADGFGCKSVEPCTPQETLWCYNESEPLCRMKSRNIYFAPAPDKLVADDMSPFASDPSSLLILGAGELPVSLNVLDRCICRLADIADFDQAQHFCINVDFIKQRFEDTPAPKRTAKQPRQKRAAEVGRMVDYLRKEFQECVKVAKTADFSLMMRLCGNYPQKQIAAALQMSPVKISRLLNSNPIVSACLTNLRNPCLIMAVARREVTLSAIHGLELLGKPCLIETPIHYPVVDRRLS